MTPAAKMTLGEPWMTDHCVVAVGAPLLARGVAQLGLGPEERIEARLRGCRLR
ncbi:MAG: hypothetical protein M3137_05115 [Actinomycetota bacterium]|nr:hypothetical protein [Actinomycetota bacterium]